MKADHDPDYVDNAKAPRVGKAFHEVLEFCHHDKTQLSRSCFGRSFENNGVDDPTEQGLVFGMVQKYLVLHSKSGLAVKGIEIEIGDRNVIGFVDAILVDENENWWIVDLKTTAKLNGSLLSRLSRDPQLNIYSYYRNQIAEICKLDPAKFAGVRYRVTTKATIKRNRNETLMAFAKRVFERVESYDIGIPKEDLNPSAVHSHFMELLKEMRSLEKTDEEDVAQNFTYCESYFKACPYWSRCYGKTFTQCSRAVQDF